SLARDMGVSLACPAHVGALRRTQVGQLGLDECVSLEALERLGADAALDPVRLLGMRMVFLDERQEKNALNGGSLSPRTVRLYKRRSVSTQAEYCACTAGVCECEEPLRDGEKVCAIARNKLVAVYEYEEQRSRLKPCCVFQTGVSRGADI
ncbi:MAG: tRNA pseudouridine(55) synthase TruB, partial [Eggerthellaceae bacterium]|nr:tRNA pseudouridine(55) synthase TruB [Eggerthellaceae bacterium]